MSASSISRTRTSCARRRASRIASASSTGGASEGPGAGSSSSSSAQDWSTAGEISSASGARISTRVCSATRAAAASRASSAARASAASRASSAARASAASRASSAARASAASRACLRRSASLLGESSLFRRASLLGESSLFRRTSLLSESSLFRRASLLGESSLFRRTGLLGESSLFRRASLLGEPSLFRRTGFRGESSLFRRTGLLGESSLLRRAGLLGESSLLRRASLLGESSLFRRTSLRSESSLFRRAGLLGESSLFRRASLLSESSLFRRAGLLGESSLFGPSLALLLPAGLFAPLLFDATGLLRLAGETFGFRDPSGLRLSRLLLEADPASLFRATLLLLLPELGAPHRLANLGLFGEPLLFGAAGLVGLALLFLQTSSGRGEPGLLFGALRLEARDLGGAFRLELRLLALVLLLLDRLDLPRVPKHPEQPALPERELARAAEEGELLEEAPVAVVEGPRLAGLEARAPHHLGRLVFERRIALRLERGPHREHARDRRKRRRDRLGRERDLLGVPAQAAHLGEQLEPVGVRDLDAELRQRLGLERPALAPRPERVELRRLELAREQQRLRHRLMTEADLGADEISLGNPKLGLPPPGDHGETAGLLVLVGAEERLGDLGGGHRGRV